MNFKDSFIHGFLGIKKKVQDEVFGVFESDLKKDSFGCITWDAAFYPNQQKEECVVFIDGDERGPNINLVVSMHRLLPQLPKIKDRLSKILEADKTLPLTLLQGWPHKFYLSILDDTSDEDGLSINVTFVHQGMDPDDFRVEFDWSKGQIIKPFWVWGDLMAEEAFSETSYTL